MIMALQAAGTAREGSSKAGKALLDMLLINCKSQVAEKQNICSRLPGSCYVCRGIKFLDRCLA